MTSSVLVLGAPADLTAHLVALVLAEHDVDVILVDGGPGKDRLVPLHGEAQLLLDELGVLRDAEARAAPDLCTPPTPPASTVSPVSPGILTRKRWGSSPPLSTATSSSASSSSPASSAPPTPASSASAPPASLARPLHVPQSHLRASLLSALSTRRGRVVLEKGRCMRLERLPTGEVQAHMDRKRVLTVAAVVGCDSPHTPVARLMRQLDRTLKPPGEDFAAEMQPALHAPPVMYKMLDLAAGEARGGGGTAVYRGREVNVAVFQDEDVAEPAGMEQSTLSVSTSPPAPAKMCITFPEGHPLGQAHAGEEVLRILENAVPASPVRELLWAAGGGLRLATQRARCVQPLPAAQARQRERLSEPGGRALVLGPAARRSTTLSHAAHEGLLDAAALHEALKARKELPAEARVLEAIPACGAARELPVAEDGLATGGAKPGSALGTWVSSWTATLAVGGVLVAAVAAMRRPAQQLCAT